MKPLFRPGQKGKASYSDTNYELLGAIVEEVTGEPIGEVFRTLVFDALDLRNTYAFQDPEDSTPVPMYYRSKQVHLPRYIASVTAEETMVFLKAFFAGRFFPKEDLDALKRWRFILSPGCVLLRDRVGEAVDSPHHDALHTDRGDPGLLGPVRRLRLPQPGNGPVLHRHGEPVERVRPQRGPEGDDQDHPGREDRQVNGGSPAA